LRQRHKIIRDDDFAVRSQKICYLKFCRFYWFFIYFFNTNET
jgi:hypothetical protein